MDNKKYYYMKLKENFFDSESMLILESLQDGILYSNILLKMYLKSLKTQGRLMLNDYIPYNSQMIATITRQQVGTVEMALKIFKELGLIEILNDGAIYMNDIELFIGQSSSEGERKKLARMRLKEENKLIGQVSDKRPPNIDIDIEQNLDKEIDKDLYIYKEEDANAFKKETPLNTPAPAKAEEENKEDDKIDFNDHEAVVNMYKEMLKFYPPNSTMYKNIEYRLKELLNED